MTVGRRSRDRASLTDRSTRPYRELLTDRSGERVRKVVVGVMTMRAALAFTSGGPEAVRVEEIDRPAPGSGEVLLEVHAAGVNPSDFRGRSGFADLPAQYRPSIARPSIPGADVCGTVVAVGADVAEFSVGDQVYGLVRFPPFDGRGHGRTHAEYVNAPVADLAPKPQRLSQVEAAAVRWRRSPPGSRSTVMARFNRESVCLSSARLAESATSRCSWRDSGARKSSR
jgi:hypothetical protein